ncbi:MAG: FkbM family methyltransferase [Phycisphaerales bacterium]|nr:FkbM family methyltransferase [Phycisphaerales bacterium]
MSDAPNSSPSVNPTNGLRPVIFDIGLHHGEDTDFYLRKGFDVVAVEADPRHVEKARERFAGPIAEGRLEIVAAAIVDRSFAEPEIEFYVNLDKDDWGSTDRTYGARSGTRHEIIRVPTVRLDELFTRVVRYGLGAPAAPGSRRVHYVKIDIEGGDHAALRGLMGVEREILPTHVSCEAHKLEYAAILSAIGYTRFKIVNQNLNWTQKLPDPPREGAGGVGWFEYQFKGHSSGPFGEEAPGEWMDLESAAEIYLMHKRMVKMSGVVSNAWFDFHAMR